MKKTLLITLFITVTQLLQAQTELSKEKYDCELGSHIGEKFYVKELTGEKLQKGDYKLKMMEGSHELFFWFNILDSGKIDGNLKLTVGNKVTDSLLGKYQVKNGIIKKIQLFNYKRKFLKQEVFYKGDTIVTKKYKINKLLYYEHKELAKKDIYKYSCDNYYGEDYIDKCVKKYYFKGIEEEILNGEVIRRIKTKNLPANIKKIIENFNNEEKEKKIIIYTNKVKEIRFKNGNYTIEKPMKGGYRYKEYNNKGKLIDSGEVYYMDDSF